MSKKTRKNILSKIAQEESHKQLIKEAAEAVSSGAATNLADEIFAKLVNQISAEIADDIIEDLDK